MKKMKIYSVELTEKEIKHLKWAIEHKIEIKESRLKKLEAYPEHIPERYKAFNDGNIKSVKNLLNELRPIMQKLNQAN